MFSGFSAHNACYDSVKQMKIMKIPFNDFLPWGVCKYQDFKDSLIECRAKARIPENARSIIVYLFPYYLGQESYKGINISKYAVSEDYHSVVGEFLQKAINDLKEQYPENIFEAFCDNSPIPEVKAAVMSGLGVKGKNGLLINKKYGSFCFIGEIVTDLEIESTKAETGNCLECGNCIRNCPDGALGPVFKKEKCLSHLTQEKGELSERTAQLICQTGCIWGCDICQNNCPMNKNIAVTPIKEFLLTAKSSYKFGDSMEKRAYSWRGRKVIERNLEIMCCNEEKNEL